MSTKRSLGMIIGLATLTSCMTFTQPGSRGETNKGIEPLGLRAEYCEPVYARPQRKDTQPPEVKLLRPSTKEVTLPPQTTETRFPFFAAAIDNNLLQYWRVQIRHNGTIIGQHSHHFPNKYNKVSGVYCEFTQQSIPTGQNSITIEAIDRDGNYATITDTLTIKRLPSQ